MLMTYGDSAWYENEVKVMHRGKFCSFVYSHGRERSPFLSSLCVFMDIDQNGRALFVKDRLAIKKNNGMF